MGEGRWRARMREGAARLARKDVEAAAVEEEVVAVVEGGGRRRKGRKIVEGNVGREKARNGRVKARKKRRNKRGEGLRKTL